MLTIIILYLFGIIGAIGCFCGATHNIMFAASFILVATAFLLDEIEDRKAKRSEQ
jgi:hypothetical protein